MGVLTVKQVARMFQLSERRTCELLNAGEIPGARKIGHEWRIAARTVFQFIDGWEKKSAEGISLDADRTSR